MAAIPIELDKLFASVPTKPAAESFAEQTDSFRRHLEQRPRASESSSASASSAANPHASDNSGAASTSTADNEKKPDRKTDSSTELDKDKPAANNDGGGATIVSTAVVSHPVVDVDHTDGAAAGLKADAESVALSGEKSRVGTSANGATTAAAANVVTTVKALAPGKNRGEATGATVSHESDTAVAHEEKVAASAVAEQVAGVKAAPVITSDESKTKAAAAHARVAKESQEKGKVAGRTKSGGDKVEPTNEHTAPNAAGDAKSQSSDEEKSQDRSHADGRLLSHMPDDSHSEPATKTHAPEPTSVARDGAVDIVTADQSAARDAIGNSQPQNSPATPNVTDVTATVRLPSHLLSRGTERTASGVHLTDMEQAKFLQRVARAFQAAQERDGEVRLRLSPPELGSLRLEIKIHEGALTARLEAESPAAKSLLLDNLPVLRERLAEQGIRIEHFDVDLLDRQPGSSPQNSPQGHERESQSAALSSPLVSKSNETATGESVPRQPIRRPGDGRLNVIV